MVRFTPAEYALLEAASGDTPVATCARDVLVRWVKLHRRRR
jgi:hypothetical protein